MSAWNPGFCCICGLPDPLFTYAGKLYCVKHRPQTVILFATLLEDKKGYYVFAPEDEDRAITIGKSIAKWHGKTKAMTVPRWFAKKYKLISNLPADDDQAWEIILKNPPIFWAEKIETSTCEYWGEEPTEK